MQTRLIHALAQQHHAERYEHDARLATTTEREQKHARALTTSEPARANRTPPEPARPVDAFPLWRAARANFARFETSVEAIEETIEALPDPTVDIV